MSVLYYGHNKKLSPGYIRHIYEAMSVGWVVGGAKWANIRERNVLWEVSTKFVEAGSTRGDGIHRWLTA